jgi:DNA helicase-2/ATP-dependent DNA helicase PcrA
VTRRGTAFHAWLESTVFGQPQLLDPDDLPGAADEGAGATPSCRAAGGVPAQQLVGPAAGRDRGAVRDGRRGRAGPRADGRRLRRAGRRLGRRRLEDRPAAVGADAEAAAVQLAAYRLAWHQLTGRRSRRCPAAFVHVRSGTTVRPVDLLDLDGLRALVTGVELAPG